MQHQGRHEAPSKKISRMNRPKRRTLLVAAAVTVLGLMITLSGIYGYSNQNQHKTNDLRSTTLDRDVFLIGEGEGKTPKDWQVNQTLKREIRVKNGVDDPIPTTQFEPLYIRLNLDEFLEFATQTNQYSEKRYLQDAANQLISFETEVAATTFVAEHDLKAVVTPEQVKTQADVLAQGSNFTGYWYLAVTGTQPKGYRSDRLVLGTQTGTPTSLIPGVVNARQDATTKHNEVKHGEDDYTTHLFDSDLSPLGLSQAFEPYITLGFSKDVISLSQWIADYDAKPVKKWIIDTGNTNGWVYWGEILPASETTTNLLETVTLRSKLESKILYYAIHADLDAVNQEELSKATTWTDLPAQLRSAWDTQYK